MPSYSRLLVASAKGGVGKSTTALGLAAAFARSGRRVLLADLDVTSRSLDMLTGASDTPQQQEQHWRMARKLTIVL